MSDLQTALSKTPCPFCGGTEFQTKLTDGTPWHECKESDTTNDEVEYWKSIVRDCIEVAEVGFGKPTTISRAKAQEYIDRIKAAKEKLNG